MWKILEKEGLDFELLVALANKFELQKELYATISLLDKIFNKKLKLNGHNNHLLSDEALENTYCLLFQEQPKNSLLKFFYENELSKNIFDKESLEERNISMTVKMFLSRLSRLKLSNIIYF